MTPLEDARAFVFSRLPAPRVATLPIESASGLVLATDVHSPENVPPFVNTAVDGYAVQAADTAVPPVVLDVVDTVAAGAARFETQVSGQAVRIMTGAPMPPGADAVVMVEDTDRLDDGARVRIKRTVGVGDAVRPAGDDVIAGALLFTAGSTLNPASIGVLASVNHREVAVYRRLRVAILSTGDELVTDGGPLGPGQIRESNKTMLLPCIEAAGCEPVDYGVVADDEAALEATLRSAAAECDAIVTSGGVSMGDYDVVKAVLSRIADMQWMQIAIKPAKPFAFGLLDGVPVFGLPGNPVSSLVSFEVVARPALRRMMGIASFDRPRIRAIADDGLRRWPDGKTHLTRVHGAFGADGRLHVRSTGPQGSHQLASTAAANGIAIIPDGESLPPGAEVDVFALDLG